MSEDVVRIQELVLENFQNVAKGVVPFACNTKEGFFGTQVDLLGIYGQNGSGKTALLHALGVLKQALRGKAPGPETIHYIMQGKTYARIQTVFSLKRAGRFYRVEYSMILERRDAAQPDSAAEPGLLTEGALGLDHRAEVLPQPTAVLTEERLKYAEYAEGRWSSQKTLLEWNLTEPELVMPKKSLARLSEKVSNLDDLRLAKKLAVRQGSSFLFSDDMKRLVEHRNDVFSDLVTALRDYAEYNLYIIGSSGWGPISMNTGLPFHFRLDEPKPDGEGKKISMGVIMLRLDAPTVFPLAYCPLLEKTVLSMNETLSVIIPGMRLKLRRLGQQLLQNGAEAITLEPVTTRDGRPEQIPLRYESEGIKKLIAMLGMFTAAYHDPAMTLAIDELDAGLHEYLLGELLEDFRQGGRGQLIFTAHNLRPLECLDKRFILFTTSDPEERYVRLKNIKANNNLRDVYYNLISRAGNQYLYETDPEQDTLRCGGS